MRNRIFLKALAAFIAVIAAATLTLDISIRHTWENAVRNDIERVLVQNAQGFALRVQNDHEHSLQQMANEEARITETRVTIIARDGVVLADTEADPKTMENHAGRPEVVAALAGKTGSSSRVSHTVGIEFLYLAVPSGDKIVRLAETGGDEIAQVAMALDRTARRLEENFAAVRESRAELEALLNSMTDGVIAVSPDMKVRWANQAIAGILHQPVRIGAPVVELLRHPDFLATLKAALQTKRRESTIITSLSGRRSFSVTAEPLPDGGVVSVLHDISEVERVEKTRRDFIANVSHELRTPLTSIRGYTETLLESDGLLTDNARDFLQVIRRNAERMGRLTEDLLVLARVESGEEKLDLRAHSARLLLAEAASSMQEDARAAEVALEVENVPDWQVMADSYAVHQVFGNLISNALRYAQDGKKIIVGANEHENGVEFFVRDFGPGIASEHLPRIFERFYRVDKARSRESGGTGLGLAIVKHIVLNHGGSVHVESAVGHGSTFFFLLPKA